MTDESHNIIKRVLSFVDRPYGTVGGMNSDCEYAEYPDHYPDILKRLLSESPNGLTLFEGYLKIFGVNSLGIDVSDWNIEESWKFAWNGKASNFWCFGGTAWGDQFALKGDSLAKSDSAEVYQLDAETMDFSACARTVEEFLCNVSYGKAFLLGDEIYPRFVQIHGPVHLTDGILPVPPRALCQEIEIEQIFVTRYESTMIVNGDCYAQLMDADEGTKVRGVQTYIDGRGRERLKINFVKN